MTLFGSSCNFVLKGLLLQILQMSQTSRSTRSSVNLQSLLLLDSDARRQDEQRMPHQGLVGLSRCKCRDAA